MARHFPSPSKIYRKNVTPPWRNIDRLSRQQMARQWTRFSSKDGVTGRSLLVVGSGLGADEFVELAGCFDWDVARISYRDLQSVDRRKTSGDDEPDKTGIFKNVDAIIVTDWSELNAPVPIRQTDFEQMGKDVTLVSIASRLPFDEDAVVAALKGGKIAFLAIDRDGTAEIKSDSQLHSFGNVLLFRNCDRREGPTN